jgi:hypothetical protein
MIRELSGTDVVYLVMAMRWLDSFIFFNTMNTELDKLHIKWLGRPMEPLPTL